MQYKDYPIEIQKVIRERIGDPEFIFEDEFLSTLFNWNNSPEGSEFWTDIDDGKLDVFYEKYPKKETQEVGQKFSKDKLPLFTTLFKQFPLAIEEVTRCTAAGHKKYEKFGDEDWQNFSRVPDAKNAYLNAAMRHLKDSETMVFNEDMKEYDPKVRHLANFAWNALAALEIEMRENKNLFGDLLESYCSLKEELDKYEPKDIPQQVNYGKICGDLYKAWGVEDTSRRGYIPESQGVIVEEHKEKLDELRELAKDVPQENKIFYFVQQESLPDWLIKQAEEFRKSIDEESEKIDKWMIANGENTPYEDWVSCNGEGNTDLRGYILEKENGDSEVYYTDGESIKVNTSFGTVTLGTNEHLTVSQKGLKIEEGNRGNSYYDRPTLTIEKLLDREDEYPDFPEETNL